VTTLAEQLREAGAGDVQEGVSLSAHTSYKIGGAADLLVQPADVLGVQTTVRLARAVGVPVGVLGWGSNLIVADEGYRGVVLKLGDAFRFVRVPPGEGPDGEEVRVEVGAATMNNHLIRELHQHGLSGAEFLALVPGTFGGAVAMNAGTKRGEAKDIVEAVRIVTRDGGLLGLDAAALQFRYRHAELPEGTVVVDGIVKARRGGVELGKLRVREEREYRNRTQPYHQPSAGSVFKNPEGDFAGRLIEEAGLKGVHRGGARFSEVHANFIVTEPGATARDILALMAQARAEVWRRFDVVLEPEQRLLGFGDASLVELLDRLAEEGR